ncbi:MAG: sensor histidine kinase [Polymorphobacter sp.]
MRGTKLGWPRSTSARIALIVFTGLVISSAIILGFIARVTQGQLDADARALISAERNAVIEMFDRDGPGGALSVIDAELRIAGPLAILLESPDGSRIVGNIRQWPPGLARDDRFHRFNLRRVDRADPEPFAVTATTLNGGYRLLVGRSLEEEERLTATLTTSLITAVGLALLLAFGISYLLIRIITGRIQGIADVAGAVAAGDLSRRVEVPAAGTGDAFDSLGGALNSMLARIEALLDELRQVTDGLAHDLRSPLTRMKARIDRVQRGDDTTGAEIVGIGTEADTLLAMLDNSLEISRVEAGIGRDNFVIMDLAALVHDMVEMYEPLAEDNGVRLTAFAGTSVPVRAHRELLGRALSNLIDNALRYGASGGSIEVTASPTVNGAELIVADRGPGIARTSHDDALRRFGRLDAARSADGAGLGLSLAAAIARLHGGALTLGPNNPGLKVAIDLPAN